MIYILVNRTFVQFPLHDHPTKLTDMKAVAKDLGSLMDGDGSDGEFSSDWP